MSKPTASIYVPKKKRADFAQALQLNKDLGISLSDLVTRAVIDGKILNTRQLIEFAAKENRTSRDKYLVVILD